MATQLLAPRPVSFANHLLQQVSFRSRVHHCERVGATLANENELVGYICPGKGPVQNLLNKASRGIGHHEYFRLQIAELYQSLNVMLPAFDILSDTQPEDRPWRMLPYPSFDSRLGFPGFQILTLVVLDRTISRLRKQIPSRATRGSRRRRDGRRGRAAPRCLRICYLRRRCRSV